MHYVHMYIRKTALYLHLNKNLRYLIRLLHTLMMVFIYMYISIILIIAIINIAIKQGKEGPKSAKRERMRKLPTRLTTS